METIVISEEVRFNAPSSTLFSINNPELSPVKLDYLESLVLHLLVQNENSLVTYEELLSHWRSAEATENSLSRVVSLLRKKLRQAGIHENVIINTAKKGYTFSAEIRFETRKKPKEKQFHLKPLHLKPKIRGVKIKDKGSFIQLLSKKIASFVAIIILASAISLVHLKATPSSTINIDKTSYTELLSNTDIKIELAYNNASNQLAYSTKTSDEKLWKIKILNRYNGHALELVDPNKNLSKPSWLNESELIYRLYDETSCQIKKATINSQFDQSSSVKIFPCNPNSYSSALAKLDDNRILIADAEFSNTASSLFIGDLRTGKVEKVNIDHGGGVGFYNVVTTPYSNLVALLSSSDGATFKVQLVEPDNNWQTIWVEELKANNFSVGWDGSSLSFRNDKGGLTVVSFEGSDEVKRTNIPTLAPTRNISSTNQGLMMISGEFVSQDLSYYNPLTNEVIPFTQGSSAKNKLAQFYDEDRIIYVSNKTGLNQVWAFNLTTKRSKQLSSFTTNRNIRAFSLEPTNQFIAIQIETEIELFNLNNNLVLSPKVTSVSGVNPEFFAEQLIFTKYNGTDSTITALSLSDFDESTMDIEGAFFAKRNGKHLLYSKRYLSGIWQHNSVGEDSLILELPSNSYRWFVNDNKIYYRNDIDDYFYYDMNTKQTLPLVDTNCSKPTAISGAKCLSKRLVPSENRLVLLEWQ